MEQLIEFDATVGLLHRDHGVAQLDQILPLHVQQLLTDLLGLFFSRKCHNDEITHVFTPFIGSSPKRGSIFAARSGSSPS
jgi:hypothetical protein